jgi:hypothetical protein
MSQYDYVDEDFPDTVTCGICSLPFVDPVTVCEEEHPFCHQCLTGWVGRKFITATTKRPSGGSARAAEMPFVFAPPSPSGIRSTPSDPAAAGVPAPLRVALGGEEAQAAEGAAPSPSTSRPCPFAGCADVISLTQVEEAKVSKQLARIADALVVRCANVERGCSWTDQRNSLGRHLEEACPFVAVPCTAGCGEAVLRSEIGVHTAADGPCPKAAEKRAESERARLADVVSTMLDFAGDLVKFNVRGEAMEAAYSCVTRRRDALLTIYVEAHRERYGKDRPVWIDNNPEEFRRYLHWVTTGEVRLPEDLEKVVFLHILFRKWGDLDAIGAVVKRRGGTNKSLSLAGHDLSGLDFTRVDCTGNLERTVLNGTNFAHSEYGRGLSFAGADLRGSNVHPQLHIWHQAKFDDTTVFEQLREPDADMWASVISEFFDLVGRTTIEAAASQLAKDYPKIAGLGRVHEPTIEAVRQAMRGMISQQLHRRYAGLLRQK